MPEIKIRQQEIEDAERFYEILNNDNFVFFDIRPATIEVEREFLCQNEQKAKDNIAYNFSIIYEGRLVGGAGIKIDQHRKFIGEIGYFIDEKYWGKGIATETVKLLEKYCFEELKLKRIEIIMNIDNKASEKVAIKAGYEKEGIMKKSIMTFDKLYDSYLYAKTIE